MSETAGSLALVSVLVPMIGALWVRFGSRAVRRDALIAATVSLAASALAAVATQSAAGTPASLMGLQVDPLSALAMPAYGTLLAAGLWLLPQRAADAGTLAPLLAMLSGTLLAYASGTPGGLALGWALSAAPFRVGGLADAGGWRPRAALLGSTVAVAGGLWLVAGGQPGAAFDDVAGTATGGMTAFALLTAGIVLRKGIVPAHAWVTDASAGGLLPTLLLINGHLGAWMVLRVIVPVFPGTMALEASLLANLALVTALYTAVRGVAELRTRHVVVLVAVSQSACVLAGLEAHDAVGMGGALLHMWVMGAASVALGAVVDAVEARGADPTLARPQGLGQLWPRLATAALLAGLAMVGLPGTLGFVSEDLLIQASLEVSPQVGVVLPLSTAINAVILLRVCSRLFMGARPSFGHGIPDARPREWWPLVLLLASLLVTGLVPSLALEAGPLRAVLALLPF